MSAPATSADFDRAYRAPFTLWGDVRIPEEVQALARQGGPRSVLELGCGVGRFSRHLAAQGMRVTGVDFSPVAIAKAREQAARDRPRPEFLVGDVTRLEALRGPYDASFDVGCFHCLGAEGQRAYVAEVSRLLKPGGIHLIWALDSAPSDLRLTPEAVREVFRPGFALVTARKSRRRLVASHWYWLVRSAG
ncbi:class I SAM-dependent methyltransferase [Corallococcus sp. RDP092CA]|uniref:class I SAM-dependent methyltransferase n=1 Tax=Corallococcus sp. RDP092CA TaxID=3109369 RepID=UPI0035B1E2A7